jgi:two-component system, response regulator YesN
LGEICIDDLKEKIHFINNYVEKFISDYENKVDSKGMNLINNIKEICNEALKDDNNKIYTNKYIENLQDEYKNKFIKFINKIYEEEKIIDYLLKKDIYAIEIFNFNIDSIYNIFLDDILKINEIAKTIFKNIILGVYKKLIWLKDYINIEFFNEKKYICYKNSEDFKEVYSKKMIYLLDFLKKHYLDTSDDSINDICIYILSNDIKDLKLKYISKNFYINSSYLSSNFFSKTGIKLNQYITMVKLARAQYLLINTNLKSYEIGNIIGYSDINYFSRLFKNHYGKTPSEYRNSLVSKIS